MGGSMPELMSTLNSYNTPQSNNFQISGAKKSFQASEMSQMGAEGLAESQVGALPGSEQSAAMQPPELPDSPNFNMNENAADKIMKQVDSYSESNPDIADNVLKHLSSFNSAQMPDDSKIMKNLPSEMKSELQPEEQSLAADEQSSRKEMVEQMQANENLKSQLSNIAEKESAAATETLNRQADIDAMAQKTLSNDGIPRNEKEAAMQGIQYFACEIFIETNAEKNYFVHKMIKANRSHFIVYRRIKICNLFLSQKRNKINDNIKKNDQSSFFYVHII